MHLLRCGLVETLLFMVLWAIGAASAIAQTYPVKPIRILTAGVGGGNDLTARLLAQAMSSPLGQQVVVENRAAGVTLGDAVARSAPDGYTLLLYSGSMWISPLLQDAPYDPVRDFAPISMLTKAPNVLVVHPSLPVKTVAELISLAKARPGDLNYSSGSTGGSSHIGGELFKAMAGINVVRIAYKGGAQEIAELLSGQVQMTFGSGTSMSAHIQAGKLRALAVSSPQPSIMFPGLPAVAASLPGYESEQLIGFFAPAKTPGPVVSRLHQEIVKALERTDVRERLLKSGLEPVGSSPEQLANSIKAEIARLDKVVRNIGIKQARSGGGP